MSIQCHPLNDEATAQILYLGLSSIFPTITTITLPDDLVFRLLPSRLTKLQIWVGLWWSFIDNDQLLLIRDHIRANCPQLSTVEYVSELEPYSADEVLDLLQWFPTPHCQLLRVADGSEEPIFCDFERDNLSILPAIRAFSWTSVDASAALKSLRHSLIGILELPSFNQLRVLQLPYSLLCDQVYRLDFPCLQILVVAPEPSRDSDLANEARPRAGRSTGFPSLATILVTGKMSHATAVVSAICGQGTRILSTIDIDCPCLEREDDLEKLSDVTTASKLSTLRHLKVNIRAVSPVETPAWSRNAEFFRRCKNLETFIIRHPRPIPFNDKDIGEFFAKMNKIKVLQLNPWPESAWDSQIALPTLECLEHARSQGRLEFTVLTHLGIFLDATKGTVEGSGTAGDYWNTLNSVVEFKSRGPSDTSSRGKLDEIFRYADILLSSDTL